MIKCLIVSYMVFLVFLVCFRICCLWFGAGRGGERLFLSDPRVGNPPRIEERTGPAAQLRELLQDQL
eukprot:4471150-Amphidinium_carterae.1